MIANWIFVQSFAATLPTGVATHFGLDGRPDGWMSRSAFLWFARLFPIGLSTFMLGVAYLARSLDPRTLHVPNAGYWQSPEHYTEACDKLLNSMFGLAAATTVFLSLTFRLVAKAQATMPPRISKSGLAAAGLLFAGALVIWSTSLTSQFQLTR